MAAEDYPTPRRSLPAANYAQLQSAVASALPGDHIVLPDGAEITGAPLTINRDGTSSNPIVIRAATRLGAELNVAIQFATTSSYCWLYGLRMYDLPKSLGLGGNYNKIRRCDIAKYQENGIDLRQGSNCAVEYTNIRNPLPWSPAQIADARAGRTPIHMGMRYQDNLPRNVRVFKVGFFDCVIGKPIAGQYDSGQSDAFEVGAGGNLAGTQTFPRLEYVVVEKWDSNKDAPGGVLDVKTSGGVFKHITFYDVPNGRFDLRCGYGHAVEDVWLERCPGMVVHDRDHVINGIRVDPSGAKINLQAGNQPDGQYSPASGHLRAKSVRLARAQGLILLGGTYTEYPALNCRIEAQVSGSIERGRTQGQVITPSTSLPAVSPNRLTRAMVGPNAV